MKTTTVCLLVLGAAILCSIVSALGESSVDLSLLSGCNCHAVSDVLPRHQAPLGVGSEQRKVGLHPYAKGAAAVQATRLCMGLQLNRFISKVFSSCYAAHLQLPGHRHQLFSQSNVQIYIYSIYAISDCGSSHCDAYISHSAVAAT